MATYSPKKILGLILLPLSPYGGINYNNNPTFCNLTFLNLTLGPFLMGYYWNFYETMACTLMLGKHL